MTTTADSATITAQSHSQSRFEHPQKAQRPMDDATLDSEEQKPPAPCPAGPQGSAPTARGSPTASAG